MIFSLEVLPAGSGDCLLLHWGSTQAPQLMLIDSGPAGFYRSTLGPRLAEIHQSLDLTSIDLLPIELAIITHADTERLRGIYDLLGGETGGTNRGPGALVRRLWFNGLQDLIGKDALDRCCSILLEAQDDDYIDRDVIKLVEGVYLGDAVCHYARAQHIELNSEFPEKRVVAPTHGATISLGVGLNVTVLAPLETELEELRTTFRDWPHRDTRALSLFPDETVKLAREIRRVSSLVVIAELNGRRMLFTGLMRDIRIANRLRSAGLVPPGGVMHVEVLQVPCRGDCNNLSSDFYSCVTADHYIFTGNGEFDLPEPEMLGVLLEARRGAPIELHFAHAIDEIDGRRQGRDSLASALRLANLPAGNTSISIGAQVIDLSEPLGAAFTVQPRARVVTASLPRTSRIVRESNSIPPNQKIDEIAIPTDGIQRKISFWLGNPASISHDDPVDLIIVSAFRNDYTPTRWSIIGALHRRGISVAKLARDKEIDLRETAGFWLSRPLTPQPPLLSTQAAVGARRILCFEPSFLGDRPAEVVGHLFRGLFPFLSDREEARIAMAVISTGALGEQPERMLRALVAAALEWMSRGLPVRELMIMEQNKSRLEKLAPVFADLKRSSQPKRNMAKATSYDVFLSFSNEDASLVKILQETVGRQMPELRLFDYRSAIDPGRAWQDEIDVAIESCRKAVAFLSPSYFRSAECKEEIGMARLRNKRQNSKFLVPLYVRSLDNDLELPLWLQAINYIDCREANAEKLVAAADRLLKVSQSQDS